MHLPQSEPADRKPIAFSYIRFSDSKQLLGDSMRRQLERSTSYAERHGLHLDESTTIRDLGISAYRGANRTAGGLGLFLEAVINGRIKKGSYLLVESFDRISREAPLAAFDTFIKIINAGVIIVTLIDEQVHSQSTINNEPMRLIGSLVKFTQANEESAKKSDRLSQVWRRKQREQAQGVIATSKCPGWLRRDGNRFVVIDERAAVVRRIFQEFIGGKGRGSIARTLNLEGIPPFGHGTEWHGGTVQKVTTNHAVIGRFQPHTVRRGEVDGPDGKPMMREQRVPVGDVIEGYYPQIIQPEVFFRAQAVATSRSVLPGNNGGRKGTKFSNIFSGVTQCVICKRRMIYKDRGPRSSIVLICSGARNEVCENFARYDYKGLEDAVLDWVHELDVGDVRSTSVAEAEGEILTLSAKHDERLTRVQRIVKAVEEGASLVLTTRLHELEAEIAAIKRDLDVARRRLEVAQGDMPFEERQIQIAALRDRMTTATATELYMIRASLAQSLREIVRVIIFHRFDRVQIVLKGGERQYMFQGTPGSANKQFVATPWSAMARSDDEFSSEEREFISEIYSYIRGPSEDDEKGETEAERHR